MRPLNSFTVSIDILQAACRMSRYKRLEVHAALDGPDSVVGGLSNLLHTAESALLRITNHTQQYQQLARTQTALLGHLTRRCSSLWTPRAHNASLQTLRNDGILHAVSLCPCEQMSTTRLPYPPACSCPVDPLCSGSLRS